MKTNDHRKLIAAFAALHALVAGCASADPAPGALAAVPAAIAAAQKANVRESWGTEEYECFTDVNYSSFLRDHRAWAIAEACAAKPEMRAAIEALRGMPEDQRQQLAAAWRKPLRKTWAQLGRITREGQTDAGQQAERDIANAIVDAMLAQCAR